MDDRPAVPSLHAQGSAPVDGHGKREGLEIPPGRRDEAMGTRVLRRAWTWAWVVKDRARLVKGLVRSLVKSLVKDLGTSG